MIYDMEYDGQNVTWKGRGIFKATSGLPGFQKPSSQCITDSGPVPEGFYKIFLSNQGIAQDDGTGHCVLKPAWGIQQIRRGKDAGTCEPYWANWGDNRVRMEPADIPTKVKCAPISRGGFYMHDSRKGFSHGCIEVESRIFSLMRNYNKTTKKTKLVLKVTYAKGRPTNGGTKI